MATTNGSYEYGAPCDETPQYRKTQERLWRSLGKRIRKGARIKS